jgi:hypothetical protein
MHDAEKTIVEELNEWSDEQFGKWFVDGLRDWHGRTYSENSFGKARILLGWHPNGSVVDEIKSLFDKLSEGGRYAFSTGLGRAISEAAVTATFCEPERHQVDVSIVIDLLGLVGLVRAGRALRNGCQDLLSERSLWWRENRVVLLGPAPPQTPMNSCKCSSASEIAAFRLRSRRSIGCMFCLACCK